MSFSSKVREDAFIACGRCCCLCHKFCGINIEVHHIIQEADGGSDTFENAIPLCFDCHAAVRAYNPRHPKGSKYTESELRRHRDNWYSKKMSTSAVITDSETRKLDISTYFKLKECLPEDTMQFISEFNFVGSFISGRLDEVEHFPYLSKNPLYEYIDADLETLKIALANSILKYIRDSIPYLYNDGAFVKIPRGKEEYCSGMFEQGVNLLNNDFTDIWEKYSEYIKLCRRKLRISG